MARTARFDRQTALEQAVHLFWERGYHATSMKQIEQSLDMRPGSIYATFGSKDRLFSEALDAYAAQGQALLSDLTQNNRLIIDGLQDYLRNIAVACGPDTREPSKACMLIKTLLEASDTHDEISEQARGLLKGVETTIAEALNVALEGGELKPGTDCRRLARLIQAQIIGLRTLGQRENNAAHVQELADDMAAMLEPFRASQ